MTRQLLSGLFALTLSGVAAAQEPPPGSARPPLEKRKFTSEAVERKISEVTKAIADPEVARIFEACYPNTLDTTVNFEANNGKPDTYIITGDINAMWLRDSSAQVQAYLSLCKEDAHLAQMIVGLIHRQAGYILIDPYANAFQKDASKPSPHNKDDTEMRPGVFERKWEVDSLCYPVLLAHQYWKITGDASPFDAQWRDAMRLVLATFRDQQRVNNQGLYRFIRGRVKAGEAGYGAPFKPTGMICSAFRDSDDATVYLFNIPENLIAIAALGHLAEIADAILPREGFAAEARAIAREAARGVEDYGVVNDAKHGRMYAYECDGLGHTLLMDDAGNPGLVSIPYFSPELIGNPLVLASRRFALSADNPFFFRGTAAEGIGSPHTGRDKIWPMGIITRAITSNDDAEITRCLAMLKTSSAGTGFMHESFNKDDPAKYSRRWFAWVNNLYGEMILKLLRERPALLSKPVPEGF